MSAAAKRATWRGSSGRSLAAADLLGAVILPFKRVAKRDAEGTLHALAAPARLRRRAIVLAYHNIVPDDRIGGGDRSLHLARHDFAAQLDLLQHTHDIVPLTELLDADASPASRTRAAITFDDAYREAITVGLPELAHHEIPRTVFVAPGYLDGGTFWWEELSAPGTGLEPGVRDVALDALGGDDHAVGEWAAERQTAVPFARREARGAGGFGEIVAATRTGLVTVGAHTSSHPKLTLVDDARVARPTAAAGYRAAFAIEGGWVPSPIREPFAIARLNVPAGVSARGFAFRSAGVLSGLCLRAAHSDAS